MVSLEDKGKKEDLNLKKRKRALHLDLNGSLANPNSNKGSNNSNNNSTNSSKETTPSEARQDRTSLTIFSTVHLSLLALALKSIEVTFIDRVLCLEILSLAQCLEKTSSFSNTLDRSALEDSLMMRHSSACKMCLEEPSIPITLQQTFLKTLDLLATWMTFFKE